MGAGANLREWKSLKALQELNLKGCYKIEDAGLQGLSLMTSLTSLNLQECWQITAQGLAAISGALAHCSSGLSSCGTHIHTHSTDVYLLHRLPFVAIPSLTIIWQIAQR